MFRAYVSISIRTKNATLPQSCAFIYEPIERVSKLYDVRLFNVIFLAEDEIKKYLGEFYVAPSARRAPAARKIAPGAPKVAPGLPAKHIIGR